MFNTRRFLTENFDTPAGVLSFLGAYGAVRPNSAAVEKWFQRGSVPSDWFPVLLGFLEIDRGAPVSVIAYLEGR